MNDKLIHRTEINSDWFTHLMGAKFSSYRLKRNERKILEGTMSGLKTLNV